MKKLNLFLTTILSITVFSQTILNQTESTTRTVSDPQAVILAPGFSAKWDVSDPFIAKIGASTNNPTNPTNSNAGSTNPSGTTSPSGTSFHDTQGNIEVNGGGQLQYTLPIALPPGVKSVAPQINLIYTSGSGNGIAGYGWNLSGITAISRVGRNIEKDGEVRGVKLDYTDYYSFNGQRLIYKSGGNGSYGSDGAEYVTEKYSNIKVKSVGSISGQQWQGPEYWEVTFEDGSQAWYGALATGGNPASRTPIEYNMVKWKDAQGNYITYNYTQASNVAAISSIEWGGNETITKSHFNLISFNYIIRDLKEISYLNGLQLVQDKLLSNVVVTTNGSQFKKYVVTYTKDIINNLSTQTINYQFVQNIQEFNSQNEPANPVTFTTKPLVTNTQEKTFGDFTNIITTGDYNGDGLIDFIVKQPAQNGRPEGYYLYFDAVNNANSSFVYLGASSSFDSQSILTYNIKPSDGYIKPKQGLLIAKSLSTNYPAPSTGDIELKYYSINGDASVLNTTNNPLILEYSKTVNPANYVFTDSQYPSYSTPANYGIANLSQFENPKEVDIDSDGMSELIFGVKDSRCFKSQISPYNWSCNDLGYRYVIIDNSDLQSTTIHKLSNITTKNILSKGGIMDFDNDGKQDIMFIEPNVGNVNVSFYTTESTGSIVQKTLSAQSNRISQYYLLSTVGSYAMGLKNTFNIKGLDKYIQFADLNGDKNIEILAPLEKGDYYSTRDMGWSISLNNGKTLSESFQGLILFRDDTSFTYTVLENDYPTAFDIDNDGKSEFVMFYNHYSNYYNHSDVGIANFREFQYNQNDPQFKWSYKKYFNYNVTVGGQVLYPIYGDFRVNNSNSKILLISKSTNSEDRKVISYQNYNLNVDKNIKTITQGGLTTNIDYKELDPAINQGFYAPVKKEQYPYMELDRVSQSYVVSQLVQEGRKQDFKYRGFLTHLRGKGALGFRQNARSSWYAEGFENTVVWSGAEIDPLNESVPIKEWSVKTYNDNNLIFPTDISENNNQLLSYKKTDYQVDILSNGVKAIVPSKTKSKDFLKDITSESEITYGNYYLPAQTNTSINGDFATSQTVMVYDHNPSGTGSDYYIGRPSSKTETNTAYGDTKGTSESYTYENNLLSGTTKKPQGSLNNRLTESYLYDGWGNIIQKTTAFRRGSIKPKPSESQTEFAQYDDKGRFVIKKTDNLNLETNITYNDWGQVLTQTDLLGVVLTNTYDDWGKLLTSKTNLAGTTTYNYYRDFGGSDVLGSYYPPKTIITQTAPDGNTKEEYTNANGQKYLVRTKLFGQNNYGNMSTEYDAINRKTKESELYYTNEAPKWNTITYDDNYFPAKVTAVAFNGKQMETSVSGRTNTVKELNGNLRTNTQTTDALGNVITSTDKGGTINFGYNASSQQISAQYGTNVVTTAYDDWGNKIEFTDPSNGTYSYEYNGLGRILLETSPKGTKAYAYNNFGQLYTQTELSDDGTSTNKSITYSYNPKGLITSKVGIANGKAYSSTVDYDSYGRVISSSENSNGKYFMKKGVTYDDKMRVTSYEKSMYSSGVYTKVTIENIYDSWSGEMYQVKDKTQNKILWELQSAKANGQVLTAKLGGTSIINTYNDNTNFLTGIQHKNSANNATVLQISYTFDALKNELNSRTRGGDFNISESFQYDDNNRLVNWTDPATGVFTQNAVRNSYDDKGRILNNDQVGEIKFNNSNKIYQATGMVLNTAGQQNYNENLLQKVTYNENNDPIFIDGMKGDVAFTYGLSEMRQTANYGGNFGADGTGKFTKYYSEDGSYEIIRNNQTGQEKHILYIGGTPYDSNIIYLKDYAEGSGSYKFLHKDYLGSILAISDEAGNAVEQRHYDAWGNFTHLKVGSQTMIIGVQQMTDYLANNNLLLDRGYTSHEHFSEVGLIHMNGRLYDPLLRRFLNADENIQDPYNTQNYNKYGYVMNNPLLYNDPSGEFFQAGFFLAYIAPVIWGAIVGAAIGAGIYIAKGLFTNNWSWGGFGKSVLMGAITGAVSGGLGQVFSASGFWGTVGNGALTGAGTGGVTSIINGDNFLEGLLKGAVIGGTVAGISYTVNYYTTSTNSETSYIEDSPENTINGETPVGSRSYARDLYEKQFGVQDGLDKNNIFNRASPGATMENGVIKLSDGRTALGVTTSSTTKEGNFWNYSVKVTNKIYLSDKAFASREQLSFVMQHELGHVSIYNAGLRNIANTKLKLTSSAAKKYSSLLDNVGHYHIQEFGTRFLELNGWSNISSSIPSYIFDSSNYQMANQQIWNLLKNTAFKININFK